MIQLVPAYIRTSHGVVCLLHPLSLDLPHFRLLVRICALTTTLPGYLRFLEPLGHEDIVRPNPAAKLFALARDGFISAPLCQNRPDVLDEID